VSELENTGPGRYFNIGWWDGYSNVWTGMMHVPHQYISQYDDGRIHGTTKRKELKMIKLLEGK